MFVYTGCIKGLPLYMHILHTKLLLFADDCRIWTRLHFWTARECGLDRHKAFLPWYIQFIGLYMQIYSYNARKYTFEDAMWSANPENIKEYHRKRNRMYDIIGILY